MSKLFSPLSIRDLTLRNRVVVAPMLQMVANDGHPTPWHMVHVGRFAIGGVGMIMMESTKVEKRGRGTPGDLGLWEDSVVPELVPIVDFAHQNGAAIGIQLGHVGRKRARPEDGGEVTFEPDIVGPSAIAHSDRHVTPRALTEAEIQDVIGSFVAATRRADAAGFDAVELHGAHGYLLHQFLSPVANHRADRYGGDAAKRMRLFLEVAEAVRAALPAGKALFVRVSGDDQAGVGIEQIVALARELKAVGVDVIDCSSGGMREDMKDIPGINPDDYGYQVGYAAAVRKGADIAAMAVGHIIHADQAEAILRDGKADLIALGREILYNPNWAMDAAQKLGEDPDFMLVPENLRYYLASRRRRLKGVPSTYGARMPEPMPAN